MADRKRKSGVVNTLLEASTSDGIMGSGAMGKSPKERKPKKPKERWLLTRKTWRYMADAGRKLIPEGALNRPEDVPKIEAYFQEVCQKEPRFLLWRKGSYPGALGFRSNRRRKERRKGGSCRTKSCSADEADDIKKAVRPSDLALMHSSGGRFDIQKLKYDFLNKPPPITNPTAFHRLGGESLTSMKEEESEENQLLHMLEKYLTIAEKGATALPAGSPAFDYQELIDKLQRHLSTVHKAAPKTPSPSTSRKPAGEGVHFEGDHVQKSLSETLSRYYSRSSNREHVISDLLTDRKLLEGLYFDLRRTRGYRSNRTGGSSYGSPNLNQWKTNLHHTEKYDADDDSDTLEIGGWKRLGKPISSKFKGDGSPMSPPPLIEIRGESQEQEITYSDWGVQTDPIPENVLQQCDEEYKKMQAEKEQEIKDTKSGYRRRSSVDNDDVSQSVSDTIKRYLRMARKKSVDSDKVDRFKRVNYDRNLRNIKAKGEITKPGDDDGLNKGCQTNDEWIVNYRDLKFDEFAFSDPETSFGSRITSSRSSYDATTGEDAAPGPAPKVASCPSSPPSGFLSSSQSFLSHLLHGKPQHDKSSPTSSQPHPVTAQAAAVMQKSKSSSSVMHHGSRLVAKKIFRSRSKSQTRVQSTPSSWTPQGGCVWSNVTGRQVTLGDTSLLQLSDVERRVLQKVALAKLQALNLGVAVRIPSESVGQPAHKSKRRAYLLKRKAKTTGFFDTGRKDDKDKDGGSTTGLVFGIPLNQCLENDRVSRLARGGSPFRSRGELSGDADDAATLRRQSHHGSRASFSSLIDSPRTEDSGSCESLMSRERIAGSVPGLLDSLSCGSTADLASATAEEEPGVPHMVSACLRHLEMHGLHTTGIFRVSSSKKRVRQLREDFDCGKEIVLDDDQCPHDVATLLKEYLRDLPDPLLCRDLYQAFVQTQRIRNRRLQLEAIQHLIQLLPVPNRDTLSALLMFLASVARNSNDVKDATGEWLPGNKMDSNNLATVFAPNILHCVKQSTSSKDITIDRPEDRIDVINVIRTMIDHHKQLFIIPAEILDEVYIHMMDSHPEALDKLLNKRDAANLTDAELLDDGESESSSAPWTPTTNTEMSLDPALLSLQSNSDLDGRQTPPEPRKTWSREEFLHENAGTGGPNVAMRLRYRERDRGRERLSKKRWRDDSGTRKRTDDSSNSSMSSAMTIITRFRSQKDEDAIASQQISKTRSSSVDSTGSVQNDGNDVNARLLRVSSDEHYGNDRRQSSPLLLDNTGVITASLKIPVQTGNQGMSLNLDDSDIPYIEDGSGYGYMVDGGKQQMTIGLLKGPTVPPRRRQRSMSGSDSSQASNIQPMTGSISVIQQGYDSAMGSSTTFSSPPHNTTPSSVGSSITGDGGLYSSPPSWASSPPTSPDSAHTSVNYIPDDLITNKQMARVPVTTQKIQIDTSAKDSASPILQKVSFTSTSELQQIKQPRQTEIQYHTQRSQREIPKSASTTSVTIHKTEIETTHPVREQKPSTSISSIGGAVLRSKTADFERMLRLGKSSEVKTKTVTTTTTTTTSEKKKYTKRRYTDSRHETRHIPDSESLEKSGSAETRMKEKSNTSVQSAATQAGPVYKRRELIASVPKDRHSIL